MTGIRTRQTEFFRQITCVPESNRVTLSGLWRESSAAQHDTAHAPKGV